MAFRTVSKTIAVAATAALILGAFGAPADAKKKKKRKPPAAPACATYAPAEPATRGSNGADALTAPVVPVTDAHTKDAPLVFEFEHGQALWVPFEGTIIVEDPSKYFNIQIDPTAVGTSLNVRLEWPVPSLSDVDLFMYDETGAVAASSGAFNGAPEEAGPVPLIGETGGMGFESISGHTVGPCTGLTLESQAFLTNGESMTLKVWLGDA